MIKGLYLHVVTVLCGEEWYNKYRIYCFSYLLTCPDFTCPGEFDDVCPDGYGREKNGNGMDMEGVHYPNVITVTFEILLFEYFADSELYVFV